MRPHPHIGLAAVTYLSRARPHCDPSVQRIEPGAINWMTAAAAWCIPSAPRRPAGQLQPNGLQLCGSPLLREQEECAPGFEHFAA